MEWYKKYNLYVIPLWNLCVYLFDWETFFNELLQYILVEVPTSLEFQHLKDQHYLNDLKWFQSQHYLGQEPISAPISVIDISANFTFFQCTVQLWRKDLLTCFWLYKGVWFLELLKLGRIIVHFLNIFSTWNLDNSHCQCMLISLALDPPFFLLMTSLLFQKMVILNFCYITKWMCISKHIRFLNLIKFFWCKRTF